MKKILTFAFLTLLHRPHLALAQVDPLDSLQDVGLQVYGTSEPTDLKVTIGRLIQVLLGFVGIVFMILIIMGGVQWMTSGGNEQKITDAKKRIINATTGLVLIVISYSIAYSVTKWLSQAVSTPIIP